MSTSARTGAKTAAAALVLATGAFGGLIAASLADAAAEPEQTVAAVTAPAPTQQPLQPQQSDPTGADPLAPARPSGQGGPHVSSAS